MHTTRTQLTHPTTLTAIAASLACLSIAHATDRLVPSQYSTIQAAVNASVNGDRVRISTGTYNESVALLGKSIELAPATAKSQVILRAPANQRALRFVAGETQTCVVRGIRLIGALATGEFGGGILVDGASPRIEQCTVDGITWSAAAGWWRGAVDVVSGAPVFAACIFENNGIIESTGGDGGALLVRGGSVRVEACVFRNNPFRQGADLFTVGSLPATTTLVGCRFEGVSGGGFGARIYNYGAGNGSAVVNLQDCVFEVQPQEAISLIHGWDEVNMTRVRFAQCVVDGSPGAPGLLITQSRSLLTVVDCEFLDNNATDGLIGIDPTQGGRAEVSGTRFCGNVPAGPDFGTLILNLGDNTVQTSCCDADVTGNGSVDAIDLAALISSWGGNGSGEFDADVTNDGVVNGLDLAVILDGWGACP